MPFDIRYLGGVFEAEYNRISTGIFFKERMFQEEIVCTGIQQWENGLVEVLFVLLFFL